MTSVFRAAALVAAVALVGSGCSDSAPAPKAGGGGNPVPPGGFKDETAGQGDKGGKAPPAPPAGDAGKMKQQ